MDNKIEQVKKILYQGYLTDIAAEKINALYQSEPLKQVVSKPEQMMICPSYPEQDKSLCSQCHHFHKHVFEKGTCDRHLTYCKGCIPVPSTPASEHIGDVTEMIAQHGTNVAPSTPSSVPLPPDELLTDEEKINITNDICKKNNTSWDEVWELPKLKTELIAIECYEAVAKAQQKKCHQSEAAKIKQLELGKKLSMESDNRIEQAIGKVLGYPAYKDDQKNFPNATESNGVCVGDHVAESLVMELADRFKAIRADQNKKIGEDLTKILLDDTIKNSISRCRTITDYVADNLIAKLQKGEF